MLIEKITFKCSGEKLMKRPVGPVTDPNKRREEKIYFSSRSNIKLKTRINE